MREQRYLEAFDAKLDAVDDEFLRLKPDALRALANGLRSEDEAIGLRASEVWFKLAGQGGYGNGANGARVSAEDIAQALLVAGGGTATITVQPAAANEEPSPPLLEQPNGKTESVH